MPTTKNQRNAYGETLVALGKDHPNVVVLEADLGKSTMGRMFAQAYPDRFFEIGIAEANMAGVAAGLSLTGKVPFMASFAVFSTGRCYDQIRTGICIPRLNVKICGSSAGLSDYGDGSTHQSVEDIAIMRALPNMQVFTPVDAVQAAQAVRYMAEHEGPMYLRLSRGDLPVYTDENDPFIPGKVYTMREGSDVAVFAMGVTVSKALEAAQALEKKGISVKVINVASVKPLDEEAIAGICAGVRGVVTAEEHSVIGGLYGAVTSALASRVGRRVYRVGIEDKFGTSAENYETLLSGYGLTADAIAAAAEQSLA